MPGETCHNLCFGETGVQGGRVCSRQPKGTGAEFEPVSVVQATAWTSDLELKLLTPLVLNHDYGTILNKHANVKSRQDNSISL